MLPDFAFALGGLLVTGGSRLLLANRLRQESWTRCPEADATILSATVCPRDRDNSPHIACVIYTYRVDYAPYSGLCAKSFAAREEALRFVEECNDLVLLQNTARNTLRNPVS